MHRQHPLDYLRIDDYIIDVARAANIDGIAPPHLYKTDDGVLAGIEFLLANNYEGHIKKAPWPEPIQAAYILLQRGEHHDNIVKRTFGVTKRKTMGAATASRAIYAAAFNTPNSAGLMPPISSIPAIYQPV